MTRGRDEDAQIGSEPICYHQSDNKLNEITRWKARLPSERGNTGFPEETLRRALIEPQEGSARHRVDSAPSVDAIVRQAGTHS